MCFVLLVLTVSQLITTFLSTLHCGVLCPVDSCRLRARTHLYLSLQSFLNSDCFHFEQLPFQSQTGVLYLFFLKTQENITVALHNNFQKNLTIIVGKLYFSVQNELKYSVFAKEIDLYWNWEKHPLYRIFDLIEFVITRSTKHYYCGPSVGLWK